MPLEDGIEKTIEDVLREVEAPIRSLESKLRVIITEINLYEARRIVFSKLHSYFNRGVDTTALFERFPSLSKDVNKTIRRSHLEAELKDWRLDAIHDALLIT